MVTVKKSQVGVLTVSFSSIIVGTVVGRKHLPWKTRSDTIHENTRGPDQREEIWGQEKTDSEKIP